MKYLIAIALLLIFISSAIAKEAPEPKRRKLYAVADIGQSTYKDTCINSTAGNCSESGIALRFGGGYQFTPMWGVEASYRMLGGPSSSQGSFTTEMKPTAIQVSATGRFPVANKLSIIGRLGVARTKAEYIVNGALSSNVSDPLISVTYGIGVQYDFLNVLGVRAQYESLGKLAGIAGSSVVPDFAISMFSAGLVFKF